MQCQVSEYITLLMQTLHQGQCFKTHHSDAAASRLRLILRLDDVWARGCTVCKGECLFVSTQHSALPCTAAFNKKDNFHHFFPVSRFLEAFWHELLYYISITVKIRCEWVHQSNTFCSMLSKVCESNDMPAQEYRCMSWLCQNDLLYRFFFSFLWVYTCCCTSKEGFGEES